MFLDATGPLHQKITGLVLTILEECEYLLDFLFIGDIVEHTGLAFGFKDVLGDFIVLGRIFFDISLVI